MLLTADMEGGTVSEGLEVAIAEENDGVFVPTV